MNAFPCPQTHLPAAICSPLPWFLILPDQICHAARRGDRLQLMPSSLHGQLAASLRTERLAASSRKTEHRLQGLHFCQSSAAVNLRRVQRGAHDVTPLQTSVQESHPHPELNRMTNYRDKHKNTNKQQCRVWLFRLVSSTQWTQ